MASSQSELLRRLVTEISVAALGTLEGGGPFVSMVPFAVSDDGQTLLVHVSRLASHTRNMQEHPAVSLLVMEPEGPGKMPQGLARVTIQGRARVLEEESREHGGAKRAYLARFPQAADLFQFPDFRLVAIDVLSARLVGGFAQATSLSKEAFARAVSSEPV